MTYQGNLAKMQTSLAEPISYTLKLGEDSVDMNALIGKPIHIHYEGVINCKICGRKTKKAFGEGLCYPHFMNHPANSPCIIKPELCEGHLGQGRDPEWEKEHHVQPHVVYLALSSAVKVGVTRSTQVPTRWMDQGASAAIKLAEVPYRRLAGELEVALKAYLTDKTSWQRMLKGQVATDKDLQQEKARVYELMPPEFQEYLSPDNAVTELHYPVTDYPEKVKSLKLDKLPDIEGTLVGIKGQYLIFEGGQVFNVRSHTGYLVSLSVED